MYIFSATPVISLLAVDEAHCVSEWSHHFRPSYMRLRASLLRTRLNVHCILAMTATATTKTLDDVRVCVSVALHLCRWGFNGVHLFPQWCSRCLRHISLQQIWRYHSLLGVSLLCGMETCGWVGSGSDLPRFILFSAICRLLDGSFVRVRYFPRRGGFGLLKRENCRFSLIAGHLIHYSIREILFDGLLYELCCLMVSLAYYTSKGETVELNYSSDMNLMKRNNKAISAGHPLGTKMSKSPKSMMKESREQLCLEMERKGQIADESGMFCESLFVTRPIEEERVSKECESRRIGWLQKRADLSSVYWVSSPQ
ncbi:hypothetical protein RHGRI_029464 [Rhododendron griersonianum]|uniref:Helicase ATP-binding domain-containing protein n=1 Tax=Rhododendron griersonianum TaxID=479676 RepID=A0AAV6IN01_9ERIC|nr:hypothetical protein RHGRI_029464 [Rhododendron griersonianum]